MIEFLVNTDFLFYTGGLVQWGFLMAFLYSLVYSINNPNKGNV
ncbi:hypothetical protein P20652_0497 [Pseudoalteromonas sp. BSi20652]|nr:hypothetical protein P20652_0497 [Pseudoalteromonas sp. BSi20652]